VLNDCRPVRSSMPCLGFGTRSGKPDAENRGRPTQAGPPGVRRGQQQRVGVRPGRLRASRGAGVPWFRRPAHPPCLARSLLPPEAGSGWWCASPGGRLVVPHRRAAAGCLRRGTDGLLLDWQDAQMSPNLSVLVPRSSGGKRLNGSHQKRCCSLVSALFLADRGGRTEDGWCSHDGGGIGVR
jgi:hypothetical protein